MVFRFDRASKIIFEAEFLDHQGVSFLTIDVNNSWRLTIRIREMLSMRRRIQSLIELYNLNDIVKKFQSSNR